jgi:protein NirF
VIDTLTLAVIRTLKPGKAILHMEFEPRGEEVWLSVRDEDRLAVYDTTTFTPRTTLPAHTPSGIFMSARAHRSGL